MLMEENETSWAYLSSPVSVIVEIMTNFNNFATNSDPLFSCIVTLYLLVLLYFPNSLKHSLSPVVIITALALLCLLRLGAGQRLKTQNAQKSDQFVNAREEEELDSFVQEEQKVHFDESGFDRKPDPGFDKYFIGWNVKAPLDVIYEAYEGEGEEDEDDHNGNEMHERDHHEFEPTVATGLERYNSLSMYYPETDSDSSSDSDFPMVGYWDSPESLCFKWEEEDREESLIEISLDSVKKDAGLGLGSGFHFEEDNLIEIDISDKNDGVQ